MQFIISKYNQGGNTCKILKKSSSTSRATYWKKWVLRDYRRTIIYIYIYINFAHIFSMTLLSMWTYIFAKVWWKNYFIKAKIIEKFGQKFKLFLWTVSFCEFFFSFFLGSSTKYDINNHIEFWILFLDQ